MTLILFFIRRGDLGRVGGEGLKTAASGRAPFNRHIPHIPSQGLQATDIEVYIGGFALASAVLARPSVVVDFDKYCYLLRLFFSKRC